MSRVNPPTIEIYPMVKDGDGATLYTRFDHGDREADFFDVLVRYDGDDPIEEVENLTTYDEAYAAAKELQLKYAGSDIEDIEG